MNEQDAFEEFWQRSSLDRFNVQQFAQQLASYDSDDKELRLEYPQAPYRLPRPNSKLTKIAANRKSTRKFSDEPLTDKELGTILSSFYAVNGIEHRTYPSAGATYTNEIFCVAFNIKNPQFNQKISYYDAEKHGLVAVCDAPAWSDATSRINVEVDGMPQLLLLFVCVDKRAQGKYGERGGRFALLELGAALQQLSLQIAESRSLKGVAAGGLFDVYWLNLLKLQQATAKLAIGYLVGK